MKNAVMKKSNLFVPEPHNLLLTKKVAKTITSDYLETAEKRLKALGVRQIRILGSYGRKDAFTESDMDVWLVCNQNIVENIKSVARLSQIELEFREKLAKKHNLHNLAKHKATILSKEEASLYQAGFHTRVAIPHTLGEQTQLSLERVSRLSNASVKNNKTADLIVSLAEFVDNWEKAVSHKLSAHTQNKWLRRIAQEVEYVTTGTRYVSTGSLNRLLSSKYRNAPKQLLATTTDLIERLQKGVDPGELIHYKLVHHLMWTLEKVRWELIDCYATPKLFEKWRHGLSRSYGFYPREIGNLVLQCLSATNSRPVSTSKLSTDLIALTREKRKGNIHSLVENFHNTLRIWLTEETCLLLGEKKVIPVPSKTILLPTTHQEKGKTISRFGLGNTARLAATEHAAYTKLFPERIIDFQNSSRGTTLTTKDLGGSPIAEKVVASMLSEYTSLLLQIHKTKTAKFGRLGSPYLFRSYKDYLISRIRYAPISPTIQNRLCLFVATRGEYLKNVHPVLCHMDPGPRNLIYDSEGKLKILDFEHAGGCCPVWDIERVLFQLPRRHHKKFTALYYGKHIPNEELVLCTRVTMLATFASNLGKEDKTLKTLCVEYVKRCIQRNIGESLCNITTFNC